MGKARRKIRIPAITLCLIVIAWNGSSSAANSVAAKVNGAEISEALVDEAVAKKLPFAGFHRNISDEKMAAMRKEALEELVNDELFFQAARGSILISERDMEEELQKIADKYGGKAMFEKELRKRGVDMGRFREKLKRKMTIDRMKEREINDKVRVSTGEVRDHYDNSRKRFLSPEKCRLREIFFSVPSTATKEEKEEKRKKAEDILGKIKAGGDFGLLAYEHSEDKFKYKSGDIGYIHKIRLTPFFRKAINGLKPGEVSGIIENVYGFYIFLLEDDVPSRQLQFEEVRDEIRRSLEKKKRNAREERVLTEMRKNADIQYLIN